MINESYTSQHQFKTVWSQLESDVRIQKRLAATAQKSQSELTKLKNELDKKAKDSGAGDKPNSEYEMLLSEKDAIIAEYVSVLDSKYLSIDIVDESWWHHFSKMTRTFFRLPSNAKK